MAGHDRVRIPPKRLRLLGIFCGCAVGCLVALAMVIGTGRAIAQVYATAHDLILAPFVLLLCGCGALTTVTLAVFALWALARLVLNLPALVLTPDGIVNHSIVYHVVLPWDELESFTYFLPGTRAFKIDTILVLMKDKRRVIAMQQPFTRLLLWVFASLKPTNISTAMTAGTPDALWERLQHYAHQQGVGEHIKFTTVPSSPIQPTARR